MNGWQLVYDHYDPKQEGLREALCTLGNGFFATRGATADSCADDVHYPGTYLAGGYNRLTTKLAGRAIENEDLVNLPNWLPLTFRVDEEHWFRLEDVAVLFYRQELDIKCGLLRRDIQFRDTAGRTTRWSEKRLVSMAEPHVAALSVELTPEDWSGRITVRTTLDGSVVNSGVRRYRDLASRHLETLDLHHFGTDIIALRTRTNQSLIQVVETARTRLYQGDRDVDGERRTDVLEDQIAQEISCGAQEGEPLLVEKIVAFHTSLDRATSEPGLEAKRTLAQIHRFEDVQANQALAWKHLWEDCDIALADGAPDGTGLKIRVHIFHLLQTVSIHSVDRDVGVPARGWHGEAYRGHIFWDELFIFPFLNLRVPAITRALLRYRYRRLPEARRAARDAGYKGAMFPWQSGSNGREESQRLHLNPRSGRWVPDNTHRQRHINAAIAYNIWQYHQVTDDHEFLYAYGAEMLLEIARFWSSIATFNASNNRYDIKGVIGPDEYHTAYPGTDPDEEAGLDNNAYTNVMAAWVLSRAGDVLDLLPKSHSHRLCEWIGLGPEEIARWYDVSRKLRVPFHGAGIISQFEGFEKLEEFDWQAYQDKYGDIQRLDRILEAENDSPNRYQLLKQADVLMLFYLFSADELALVFEQLGYPFDRDTIPRNLDYYLARTSHGSTLSRIANSWVLARSDRPRSWSLFRRALDSDIDGIQRETTQEGIHVGAMAGTVDLVQRCYLGIEMRANALYFDPVLPDDLGRVTIQLRYRRQILDVDVDHEMLRIASRPFPALAITVAYRGRFRDVAPGDTYEFRLIKPDERDRDENRPTHQAV
jgi:alpha,alpha-trehalase